MDPAVLRPLVDAVWASKPHLVVISGDFVQNGFRREFEQARAFVDKLPQPLLLVPGNHDLPFTNLWKRFTVGLDYYRQFLTHDLEPFFLDAEIAVIGVSTARHWPLRGGRISAEQVARIEMRLCRLADTVTRILVTHHPFDLDPRRRRRDLVGRAPMAMGRLAHSVDILLAGHMHLSQCGHTGVRYRRKNASAIFVQAGTATSTRGRGEPNSFNLLRIRHPSLVIERQRWNTATASFERDASEQFPLDRVRPLPPAEPDADAPVESSCPGPASQLVRS